jgi:FdrA protein
MPVNDPDAGTAPVDRVAVRAGVYADSVTLLQLTQTVGQAPGVHAALVAMATELNLQLLTGMGFAPPPTQSPHELFIAVRAGDSDAAQAATELAEQLLAAPRRAAGGEPAAAQPSRTLGKAADRYGAGLALISVPGQHAFTEAMDALQAGCDVLLFSDNVSVEQEITLKDAAAERGLLVMGPDCGTAVVGGVGLGFAHTLQPGPVGLVAASGTGAQQLLCLLDAAGVGISAALGVGGRDLSEPVAGRSSLAALELLDGDPTTELILVVSKPPAAPVAERLRSAAAQASTPVRFALLGPGQPDLTAAAEAVLGELGVPVPDWPRWPADPAPRPATRGWLRGLFCGGTLCDEAMLIASAELGTIRSNIPLQPDWALPDSLVATGHSMIDFGADELTRGRAHPMIDPSLRNQQLRAAAADPETAVLLLDVLLGHGAHPDPVAELLPVLAEIRQPVVISLIGARQDRQDLAGSARRLAAAGAEVFCSNAMATRHALTLLATGAAA